MLSNWTFCEGVLKNPPRYAITRVTPWLTLSELIDMFWRLIVVARSSSITCPYRTIYPSMRHFSRLVFSYLYSSINYLILHRLPSLSSYYLISHKTASKSSYPHIFQVSILCTDNKWSANRARFTWQSGSIHSLRLFVLCTSRSWASRLRKLWKFRVQLAVSIRQWYLPSMAWFLFLWNVKRFFDKDWKQQLPISQTNKPCEFWRGGMETKYRGKARETRGETLPSLCSRLWSSSSLLAGRLETIADDEPIPGLCAGLLLSLRSW